MELALITEIYDRASLSVVIDEYSSSLSVRIVERGERETIVRFSDVSGVGLSDATIRGFLNRLLDLSVRTALRGSLE